MSGFAFARREVALRPSPVRSVFQLGLDPAYMSLASGDPDVSMLPRDLIADLSARLLRERGAEILQYGSGAGVDSLVATIDMLMRDVGASASRDTTLVTAGSQMGIDLATKLFCDPGDTIVAEGPTYISALGVFGAYEVSVRHVDIDDEGIDPDAVATTLDELAAEGRPARFVYVIPHHQNPTGVTLTEERRHRLVQVCGQRGVPIVEDDPYAFVGFPGTDPLPSLYSMNPDGVVYLGSMSKLFSPGLRVGWVCAQEPVVSRMRVARTSLDIHPSILSQEIAAAWVGTEPWRRTLDRQRAVYAERCRATLDALAAVELPDDVTWTRPSGGFFTWLTLPGLPPETDLLTACLRHHVVAVPGTGCYATPPRLAHLRLAFSATDAAELTEGVRRVAATVADLAAERG